jgi:5-methylcytosine-specific restriction enzyme subunit McrC
VIPLSVQASTVAATPFDGYVGRVPVHNLWLLMLYASDLFRSRGAGRIGLEDSPDEVPDLVAEILARAVEVRLRRRLTSGYISRNAVVDRVRGRINVLDTERHQWLARGRVACRFEELSIDSPQNRFVRTSLERISRLVRRADIRARCRSLAMGLKNRGVSGNAPTLEDIKRQQIGHHARDDDHMMSAAKLAWELGLPTETSGTRSLVLPERDEVWVRKLFERGVGGFYDVVLSPLGVRVRCGKAMTWQVNEETSQIDKILPSMRADIILDSDVGRLVIDTKFNSIVTAGWHREETLRSGYLYQIYTYVRSQVGRGDVLADNATGMLLHPSVGKRVDESVVIQGHRFRFATVDLGASTGDIRTELLRLSGVVVNH